MPIGRVCAGTTVELPPSRRSHLPAVKKREGKKNRSKWITGGGSDQKKRPQKKKRKRDYSRVKLKLFLVNTCDASLSDISCGNN